MRWTEEFASRLSSLRRGSNRAVAGRKRKRKALRGTQRCSEGHTERWLWVEPRSKASRLNLQRAARVKPNRLRVSWSGSGNLATQSKRGRRGQTESPSIFFSARCRQYTHRIELQS